jgi:hypothetical protein
MDHLVCRLPEPVSTQLIELGMAQPVLTGRGPGLDIGMEILGGAANIVVIVAAKDAITEMIRTLFRVRRAEVEADQHEEVTADRRDAARHDRTMEIRVGDDFYLRCRIPDDASMDGAVIAEIVDAVINQLPAELPDS